MKHSAAGYSLLELAVVLTIIGLITGTIVIGNDLMRSSGLTRTISQMSEVSDAITQFRDKYQALPGDIINATGFWGASAGCPAPSNVKQKTTCNGDGNGFIDNGPESFLFWQHLANSGLTEGSYSGAATSGAPTPGLQCLAAPSGGCWGVGFIAAVRPASWQLWADYLPNVKAPQHILSLGKHLASAGYSNPASPLTASQVLDIDTKIDDGKPATGRITTRPGFCLTDGVTCAASDCISAVTITATYSLNPTREGTCNLDYYLDF
jgi:hypothetical protein